MKINGQIKKTRRLTAVLFLFVNYMMAMTPSGIMGNSLNKASEWPFTDPFLYIKGGVNAVTKGGGLILWAVGDTISVIDKNSFSRICTFRVTTGTTVTDMIYDASTSILYVAAGYDSKEAGGGLQVFSLADPGAPVMTGAYYKSKNYPGSVKTDDTGGAKAVPDIDAKGLGLSGSTLFLADNNYGLRVFDISNPANPYEVPLTAQTDNCKSGYKQPDINGSYLSTGGYIGLGVYPYNGKVYAFVLDYYHGVDVFDVTDPQVIGDPVIKDTRTAFWFGSVSLLSDIFIAENGGRLSAYVSGTNYNDTEYALTRLDVSFDNNTSIVNSGYCELPNGARGITVAGDYAYIADSSSGLQIVTISNQPASSGDLVTFPIVGSYTEHTNLSYSVLLDGTALYLACGETGLNKIDVSGVSSPVLQGRIDSPLSADDICVSGDGNYVYMLDRKKGLRIFNISVPEYPILKGYLGNTAPESQAADMVVAGNYAFIAYTTGKIRIADVTDPGDPVFVDASITAASPESLFVSGNTLYMAEGTGKTLKTVSITDPLHPLVTGSVVTKGNASSVFVSDYKAYVSEGNDGVEIFDVTDPSNPIRIAGFATDDARASAIFNNGTNKYLVVADGSSGIMIEDVTHSAFLSTVVTLGNMGTAASPVSFTAVSVSVIGNTAFIGIGVDGVLALDITTPSSPSIVSHYVSPSFSSDISAYKIYDSTMGTTYTYLAVADGSSGFKLLYLYDASSVDTTPLDSGINSGCFIETLFSEGEN